MELERELIIQCQKGQKSSFGKLVSPYIQDAYSISFTILKSKEYAEDAVQNALIEVYKNIMANKEIRKFRSWFLTIVASRSIDLARKNIKEWNRTIGASVIQIGSNETPLTNLLDKERNTFVTEAVLALPLKYRTVISLFYFQELTIKEIAKLLETKEGTIKSRLYKARECLNHTLTRRDNIPKAGE